MTMTDPIADMLTRIRNACAVKHEQVSIPYSKFKEAIAEILKREGYISSLSVEGEGISKSLVLGLKYTSAGESSIRGIKRVSKPGLRKYAKSDNLPKPLGGLGVAIISTSSGLMTQRECRKQGIGGEVVAYVW